MAMHDIFTGLEPLSQKNSVKKKNQLPKCFAVLSHFFSQQVNRNYLELLLQNLQISVSYQLGRNRRQNPDAEHTTAQLLLQLPIKV